VELRGRLPVKIFTSGVRILIRFASVNERMKEEG